MQCEKWLGVAVNIHRLLLFKSECKTNFFKKMNNVKRPPWKARRAGPWLSKAIINMAIWLIPNVMMTFNTTSWQIEGERQHWGSSDTKVFPFSLLSTPPNIKRINTIPFIWWKTSSFCTSVPGALLDVFFFFCDCTKSFSLVWFSPECYWIWHINFFSNNPLSKHVNQRVVHLKTIFKPASRECSFLKIALGLHAMVRRADPGTPSIRNKSELSFIF